MGGGSRGGEACVYIRMVVHDNYVTTVSPSPWLNLLSLPPLALPVCPPTPPPAVLPPGRVGQHGALDALLRRLLGHLAHLPHRS